MVYPLHMNLGGNALAQGFHVTDDAYLLASYLVQLLKGFHHRIQVVTVQRTETFVDKQHIHRKTFPVE